MLREFADDLGSSPLTRGGLQQEDEVRGPDGLIPAYAGRTNMRGVTVVVLWAHPRLRGAD